ncbi:sulfite exporter TauE/SafE family protein [Flaviflexus massiliensis]|uniref:sulfite exporter TauE/SafE family protein n=1 Tax=Flaviflexus massiliensis TaxID=1522309 RepID=UPI001C9D48CA|nr:sulfite exporter TauE/SafE family protein [Flaviflexus massiliensis]
MTGLATLLMAVAVVFGGVLQRISGMGMGLVLSPFLALLLGANVGVTVTNVATVLSSFLIGFVLRSGVDRRRFAIIAPAGLLGTVPGAYLVKHLDGNWLSVIVGTAVLIALTVTLTSGRVRTLPHLTGPWWLGPFAALGAFLNVVAGVAAPALVIYSLLSRWEQRSFAATLQPTFLWFGLTSVITKIAIGATHFNALPPAWVLLVITAAIVLAIALGGRLSLRVSPQQARRIGIAVAGLGAVSAIIRGLVGALS